MANVTSTFNDGNVSRYDRLINEWVILSPAMNDKRNQRKNAPLAKKNCENC